MDHTPATRYFWTIDLILLHSYLFAVIFLMKRDLQSLGFDFNSYFRIKRSIFVYNGIYFGIYIGFWIEMNSIFLGVVCGVWA